jgi:hypothetical protein
LFGVLTNDINLKIVFPLMVLGMFKLRVAFINIEIKEPQPSDAVSPLLGVSRMIRMDSSYQC